MQHPTPNDRPAGAGRPLAWSLTALAAVAAGLVRMIPFGFRPPNCTPVGALGVYSGARLPWWAALTLPLAVMAGTDYLLAAWFGLPPYNRWVYASFIVYALLGRLLVGRSNSAWRVGAVSALGSVQFFLITNFGVWLGSAGHASGMYPPTAAGLIECYGMALPFFGYTLLGDLGFAGVLFGAHAWLARDEHAAAPAPAAEEARV